MLVKKMSAAALAGALLTASLSAMSMAAEKPMQVEVNGKSTSLTDAQPFMDKNQRMQVPIRFISEALGAKVGYDAGKKLITLTQGSKVITLTTGSKSFTVNGQTQQMDTSAVERSSRIYVPLRFVSQALDAQLSWDPETNSVKVTSPDGVELKLKAEEPKEESTGTVKDWYGFKVITDSDSKLLVDKGSYEKYKTSYLFSFLITFGYVGENHQKQLKEVESILRQKVESNTVDKVMKYVKSKTKRDDELPMKSYKDSKYEIVVISDYNGDVNVKVYYK
ncbi:hypothetical protein DCC85_02115 [Paenibacillus sp. CAA11]|uniref:copper amine oxidase N-terminal domain-containing protein n=1 Tax=Paenibacillus sp. CAA11 TaxID=1532905 RepID=UPI000D342E85|nr:copper amine oxidase N-terminal domain-containing protein [Paenibacillus sp. CAA11]AWB43145.1 hypothetical protein DCC85_02115 [Paenibacillus sp. CAA11]